MSSEAQIAANRRNAQFSTGPSSSAGKSVSRFNNLKTGIHAKASIIPGESAEELAQLAADYHLQFQPADPEQRALVDSLVSDEWLLRRYRKVECSVWEFALTTPKPQSVGEGYARHMRVFNSLHRRIANVQRSYNSALRQLRELQAAPEAAASEVSQTSAPPPELASVLHSSQTTAPPFPSAPVSAPVSRPSPEDLALRL